MSGKRVAKEKLTDMALKALAKAPEGKRVVVWDASVEHFGVRVTDKGVKTFVVVKRIKGKKAPITHVIGTYPAMSLSAARIQAKQANEMIASGLVPRVEKLKAIEAEKAQETNTFEAVAKDFVAKHLVNNRTSAESERIINTYLLPRFGKHQFAEIRRREIADLMDDLAAGKFRTEEGATLGGPVMADHVLACLRKLTNWYASRNEDYASPIVKGMARTSPKDRARDRVLSDHELQALWAALSEASQSSDDRNLAGTIFASLVRMLLLTAQRRDDVAAMQPAELAADGIWTIPAERYKTNKAQEVPLSGLALKVLEGVPSIGKRKFIFTTDGETAFSGFSKAKAELDIVMLKHLRRSAEERKDNHVILFVTKIQRLKAKAAKGDEDARNELSRNWWRLHDLRRTGKTLMIRAGVRPDISERVIGHTIKGVEGVYDRYSYRDEKREALELLANTVESIVAPSPTK
jgi:integrase